MNNVLVTTGQIPLTVGSNYTFLLQAFLGGVPWNLAGGSVTIKIKDPNGNINSYSATISGMVATFSWPTPNIPGQWSRAWFVIDANGIVQNSLPIPFQVAQTP